MSFRIPVLLFLGAWLIGTALVLADNNYCGYSQSCESNQICCNHQCVYDSDCFGRTCSYNSGFDQCSGIQCCDDRTCKYSCYDDTVPILIGTIGGVCVFIFILSIIIYCIFCKRRYSGPRGGYIITHPQAQVHTTTTAANFNQTTTYPTAQPYGQQVYGRANPQYGYGAI